ncbi:MAG: hypothetical protein QOJ32_2979 [Frankiaceae bacterium]|nr:hypothetical protein [Frankiaceae bacterium]
MSTRKRAKKRAVPLGLGCRHDFAPEQVRRYCVKRNGFPH